tara:strand:+ start:37633 stop:38079 length:447 start_codon:yes stop_codon:yes gene_type:complete
MNFSKHEDNVYNSGSLKSSYIEENNSFLSKKSWLFISHKILDSLNFSILILIVIFSSISFNSQSRWTNLYSMLKDIRTINNNLIDYISTTEELYIKEIDQLDNIKQTTSKDLIYLYKNIELEKINSLTNFLINIRKGIQEGKYQRGYL